jgi:hypothetical protein
MASEMVMMSKGPRLNVGKGVAFVHKHDAGTCPAGDAVPATFILCAWRPHCASAAWHHCHFPVAALRAASCAF